MNAATDRLPRLLALVPYLLARPGVPIDEVKRRSALAKDISTLDTGVAAALGLER